MDSDFLNIEYLKAGTPKQQKAYKIVKEVNIFNVLDDYNPILAGTIPIRVDLPDSDLDIICEVYDFERFKERIINQYGEHTGFNCKISTVNGWKRIVSRFDYKSWRLELFGQAVPTIKQNAYRHMIIEHRILNVLGDKARTYIIDLKKKGYKTEPAFGQLLQIQSDPYSFLLEMWSWDEEKLKDYLRTNSIDVF